MPRNGSGSYSLPQAAFVAGTTISSASMNSDLSDIATALTGSLPRDGQAGMTGQLKVPDGSSIAPALTFSNESNTGFTRPNTGQIGFDILGVQIAFLSTTGFTTTGLTATSITGPGLVPAGTVVSYAGASAPSGWVLCFGQAISRTTNAPLFAVIGTTYGSGDGSTTFNVPDYRDYILVGKGNMGGSDAGRLTTAFYGSDPTVLGNAGGSQSHALTTAELATHNHGITDPGHLHNTNASQVSAGQWNPGGGASAAAIGATASYVSDTKVTNITINNNGSGTAHAIVQPSVIVNKIIYTGG